ncbi:hypothetical protein AwDysgo_15480 [Bacteroidales bacterium]|nr:hypothetical protein AwDysgo_15480 [Bacteroidales bacterium]
MRSVPYLLVCILVACLFISSANKQQTISSGLKLGSVAPEIHVHGNTLEELRGEGYLLLQFWAAYDGNSRLQNVMMHNKLHENPKNDVNFISVSFDYSKSVFAETIKRDRLEAKTQFFDDAGKSSQIWQAYNLNSGFGNVLIDPQGLIVGKNLSAHEVLNFTKTKI